MRVNDSRWPVVVRPACDAGRSNDAEQSRALTRKQKAATGLMPPWSTHCFCQFLPLFAREQCLAECNTSTTKVLTSRPPLQVGQIATSVAFQVGLRVQLCTQESELKSTEWVGTCLQVGNGIVNPNDQDKLDHPFGVRNPSFSWVNGPYEIRAEATQLVLVEMNARKFRVRRSALGRWLRWVDVMRCAV